MGLKKPPTLPNEELEQKSSDLLSCFTSLLHSHTSCLWMVLNLRVDAGLLSFNLQVARERRSRYVRTHPSISFIRVPVII